MESSFKATFELPGAPSKSEYIAKAIDVIPNAPPLPTQAISTYETTQPQRSFSLTFLNPISDGDHKLDDQSVQIDYQEGTDLFTAKDIDGNIKTNGLEGRYVGNAILTLVDKFQREWKTTLDFDITVVPQK